MKYFIALLVFTLFTPVLTIGAAERFEVLEEQTFVYETPNSISPVARQLYVGEVVDPVEVVYTIETDETWVKVRLGAERFGYIKAEKLSSTSELKHLTWEPPVIIRNERPLGMGLRAGGETFGATLNIRYLAFTRLGISFSAGPVVDEGSMKGTALSLGLTSFFVLKNFSPYMEMGVSRLSYHNGTATLRINAFYMGVGLEWMFDKGMYINVGATYLRSMDVEVAYEYENVKNGSPEPPGDFGVLNPDSDGSFQKVVPSLTIGYAF